MPGALVSLPLVGPTTIEDVAFYGVLSVVTVAKLVSWPTAALIGSAHVLHQRARNLRWTPTVLDCTTCVGSATAFGSVRVAARLGETIR